MHRSKLAKNAELLVKLKLLRRNKMILFKSRGMPRGAKRDYENWALQLDDGRRLYGGYTKEDLTSRLTISQIADLEIIDD
jgi:hypothetical protein